MKRRDIVIGRTYTHRLDGRDWRVKVTTVEYDKDQQRHLWTGIYEDTGERSPYGSHACWGWVSELREDLAVTSET